MVVRRENRLNFPTVAETRPFRHQMPLVVCVIFRVVEPTQDKFFARCLTSSLLARFYPLLISL